MSPISNSTANALRRLDDFDHLGESDRIDALVDANLLDAMVDDHYLPRFTKEEVLEKEGVDPDDDSQVRYALNEYSRHDVWRDHALREEYYSDDHVMSLLPVHVLEVASSTYGMDWDPQNEDPYLAAVERLVVSQRLEALGTIAQDSRPATTAADLASPKEALARRNRSRCM